MTLTPRGTPLFFTFTLLGRTVHAVPNDREDKRNAGNDKGGNGKHYSSFKVALFSFFGERGIALNGARARVFKKNFHFDDITKNKAF